MPLQLSSMPARGSAEGAWILGNCTICIMNDTFTSHQSPPRTCLCCDSFPLRRLHRQPDHLLQFLFAELGTSGSVDSSNALVIRGRFQQKQIESVLRRYIREYVTCRNCKSPDTILVKENRLHFLQCLVRERARRHCQPCIYPPCVCFLCL